MALPDVNFGTVIKVLNAFKDAGIEKVQFMQSEENARETLRDADASKRENPRTGDASERNTPRDGDATKREGPRDSNR